MVAAERGTGGVFRVLLPAWREPPADTGAGARVAKRRISEILERLPMKVLKSLRSAKNRHRDCKVVRRKGKVLVINKTNPRFKARQG